MTKVRITYKLVTMKKKLVFFLVVFLISGLSWATEVEAMAVNPNCYTGKGACGGGGGGDADFTVADQVATCSGPLKEDCIQLFCVQKIDAGGAFTAAELDQICRQLGYEAAPTVSQVRQQIREQTPTGEQVRNQVREEKQVQNQGEDQQIQEQVQEQTQERLGEDQGMGLVARVRSFFANFFGRLFGR